MHRARKGGRIPRHLEPENQRPVGDEGNLRHAICHHGEQLRQGKCSLWCCIVVAQVEHTVWSDEHDTLGHDAVGALSADAGAEEDDAVLEEAVASG